MPKTSTTTAPNVPTTIHSFLFLRDAATLSSPNFTRELFSPER